ncbi:Uncharacterised protein [Bordetella pertussis]|nr:Uncharacterised protein [Bordetella pertussis]CFO70078.1 Uncharacterised protein [Bordetella pertussis]CFP68349.1 Uncharacterised protein [Bordetella pertussis]CPI59047.1 Uncharacterised protein [Bordetella pertussis]CPK91804.1 Uncharacterised protein [Bordetella pertussis]
MARSSRSISLHRARYWPSLPTATMTSPSLQRNTWYGTMFEWALPMRRGILPDRKWLMA